MSTIELLLVARTRLSCRISGRTQYLSSMIRLDRSGSEDKWAKTKNISVELQRNRRTRLTVKYSNGLHGDVLHALALAESEYKASKDPSSITSI